MTTLSSSQRIVDLLLNRGISDENAFTHYPAPNEEVKFQYIFPFNYAPETSSQASAYICYNFAVPRVFNKTYKNIELDIHVTAETSLIKMKQGTRVDLLAEEIDAIFNGNMEIGLDRMSLLSVYPISPVEKYHGLTMRYVNYEWNR